MIHNYNFINKIKTLAYLYTIIPITCTMQLFQDLYFHLNHYLQSLNHHSKLDKVQYEEKKKEKPLIVRRLPMAIRE